MQQAINLYCGYDERESLGFHTFVSSVIRRSSRFVKVTPLPEMGMGHGSNAFTVSRFLVPWLNDFKGKAIFADAADMLCLDDIEKLDRLFNPAYAIQVVRHADYISQHERKYVDTNMECENRNYSRKNWASIFIANCEHPAWRGMTPQGIVKHTNLELLQFQFLLDKEIGSLPAEWNCLVDEGQADECAKILHWTAGAPFFNSYKNARRSNDWFLELASLKGE